MAILPTEFTCTFLILAIVYWPCIISTHSLLEYDQVIKTTYEVHILNGTHTNIWSSFYREIWDNQEEEVAYSHCQPFAVPMYIKQFSMTYNRTTINLKISHILKWFTAQTPYLIQYTSITPHITWNWILSIV